ncbi:MAG: cold-shock protein [Proteobacteria bacterium]|nr:cold-shock protein [Pseudomonadota bacterium]
MQTGTVKSYNGDMGYGYIAPDDGLPDVFVHFTALDLSGVKSLGKGQLVVFLAVREGGIVRATNLRVAVAA